MRAYYNDGKSTYEIVIRKSTGATTVKTIASRNYLLIPDGFSLATLLIPGNPAAEDMDMIQLIMVSLGLNNPVY